MRGVVVNSLLEQLGNEAVLMMHLAGELPDEDAAEVSQLLESDASLREQFEALRDAHSEFLFHMALMDGAERAPLSEESAVRQTSRIIAQWRIDEAMRRPVEEAPVRGLRYPWWAYPMATAAAVFLAFLVWWGNNSSVPGVESDAATGNGVVARNWRGSGPAEYASGVPDGMWNGETTDGSMGRVIQQWHPLMADDYQLRQAEEQLVALNDSSESSILFPPDANW